MNLKIILKLPFNFFFHFNFVIKIYLAIKFKAKALKNTFLILQYAFRIKKQTNLKRVNRTAPNNIPFSVLEPFFEFTAKRTGEKRCFFTERYFLRRCFYEDEP